MSSKVLKESSRNLLSALHELGAEAVDSLLLAKGAELREMARKAKASKPKGRPKGKAVPKVAAKADAKSKAKVKSKAKAKSLRKRVSPLARMPRRMRPRPGQESEEASLGGEEQDAVLEASGEEPPLKRIKSTKKSKNPLVKASELEWDPINIRRNQGGRLLIKTKLDNLRRADLVLFPKKPVICSKTGVIRADVGIEGYPFVTLLTKAADYFERLWREHVDKYKAPEKDYGAFVIRHFAKSISGLEQGDRQPFCKLLRDIVEGCEGTSALAAPKHAGTKSKVTAPTVAPTSVAESSSAAGGWDADAAVDHELSPS